VVLTNWCVSKLPADNSGINIGPWVITDCSPLVVVADLHSALVFSCTTNKSQSTSCAINILRTWLESPMSFEMYRQYFTPLTLQHYGQLCECTAMSAFNDTWALNTNIIIMTTVGAGDTNPIVRTLQQISLISSAGKVIKPDWPTSSSIEGIYAWNRTCRSKPFWYWHLSLV